jgi:hypothetical protein
MLYHQLVPHQDVAGQRLLGHQLGVGVEAYQQVHK